MMRATEKASAALFFLSVNNDEQNAMRKKSSPEGLLVKDVYRQTTI